MASWTSRRRFLTGLAGACLSFSEAARGSPDEARPVVAVLAGGVTRAYSDAMEAIRTSASLGNFRIAEAQLADGGSFPVDDAAGSRKPALLIALGSAALNRACSARPAIPVVASLVLRDQLSHCTETRSLVSAVCVNIGPAAFLPSVKRIFPGSSRLAVAGAPHALGSAWPGIAAEIRGLGYEPRCVECEAPSDVVDSFVTLRGRADFVWLLPDRDLYDAGAIQPIILSSLRNRLPIIGFSESFARAGALVSAYPDYRAVGVQTAALAGRFLGGHAVPPREIPREVRLALNERVLRLLGNRWNETEARNRAELIK